MTREQRFAKLVFDRVVEKAWAEFNRQLDWLIETNGGEDFEGAPLVEGTIRAQRAS